MVTQPAGQQATQAPHWTQAARSLWISPLCRERAPNLQILRHAPHCSAPKHFLLSREISGSARNDSGLQHQKQRRGHPLRKTVVRIPGPSCKENFCMLKTSPLTTFSSLQRMLSPDGGIRQTTGYHELFMNYLIQIVTCSTRAIISFCSPGERSTK